MDWFQIRKNSRQVVRIYRGPYEGFDITRLQIWYRRPGDDEYKPGRIIAFNSELIPAAIEGLMRMATRPPVVEVRSSVMGDLTFSPPELARAIQRVLRAHKRPLHWENIATIVKEENPRLQGSRWTVYNTLLASGDLFEQVDEDVFVAR